MLAVIKAMRAIVIVCSFATWGEFMLITADVPPNVTLQNLYHFVISFFLIGVITLIELYMCIKNQYRGGYFTLFGELIVLILWTTTYCGGITAMDYIQITSIMNCISIGGIISCVFEIIAQVLSFVKNYRGKE